MRLKTPSFWYDEPGLYSCALTPLSWLYGAGHMLHQAARKTYHSKLPVICIGNIVSGGSGKTPTAIAVFQLVKSNFLAKNPCFLSRGYGGKAQKLLLVNRDAHTAEDVGDEALLLAKHAPTITSADRVEGARYAERQGYDLIIMDDGLQNPALHQDIRLVVVDGVTGFGNRKTLPAGPLRESLKTGLAKGSGFIIVGHDKTSIRQTLPADRPVFPASIEASENWIADTESPYVAFCGIAHPDKFKTSLQRAGINIAAWHPFPDHYVFSHKELQQLAEEAQKLGGRLITTAKDAARLPAEFMRDATPDILPIELRWQDQDDITAFLKQRMESR